METADANDLIERYQALLSNLLLRRAVEGPLPDNEEARLAQEQADLWETIPEERHAELETWIDDQVRRADPVTPPVSEYVANVRQRLIARALSGSIDASSEARLDQLLAQMSDGEAKVVQAWREKEEGVPAVSVGAATLPFQESREIRHGSRHQAA